MSKVQEISLVGGLLVLISVIYLFGIATDMTWMGLAGDSPNYVVSSVLFQKAFLAGYPFYITIGWVFERLPFNPYWNLGLVSALSTIVTSVFIFLIIRLFTGRGWSPFLGLVAYPAAFLVWTQSVIPEVYTFSTMLAIVGAYFVIKGGKFGGVRNFYIAAVVFGLSLGAHPLAVFTAIAGLVYVYRVTGQKFLVLKLSLVGSLGLLTYLQIVFTPSTGGIVESGLVDKVRLVVVSFNYLGGLSAVPVWATIDRVTDAIWILLVSVGVIVPLGIFGKWTVLKEKEFIIFLIGGGIPFLIYISGFPPQWVTYMVPFLAFFIIIVGIRSQHFPYKEGLYFGIVGSLVLLGVNLYHYDIGRSLDQSPTTMRQVYDKLDGLSDGTIVYTHTWGHISVLVDTYNKFNKNRLVSVDIALRSTQIEVKGVNTPHLDKSNPKFGEEFFDVQELLRLNPGREIYVAYISDAKKVEFDLIPASDYGNSLNSVQRRFESNVR